MGAAPSPGAHTWVGGFCLGLSKDSNHKKEAFEFLSYLTGPAGQRKFAEGGGTTCRTSLLKDQSLIKGRRELLGHYPILLQILDHNAQSKFYPNFFYVPQSGKIYDEETAWFSAAASGQKPVKAAMEHLAEAIRRHCRGDCEVINDHLGPDFHAEPAPFKFDPTVWIRK